MAEILSWMQYHLTSLNEPDLVKNTYSEDPIRVILGFRLWF
jgi:hypothetical protein